MNGPEHYAEAERLIEESKVLGNGGRHFPSDPDVKAERLARAQVHATLALTAATAQAAFDPEGRALVPQTSIIRAGWETVL